MKLRKVFVFLLVLTLLTLPGCSEKYQVRDDFAPGEIFTYYDELTSLVGTVGKNEVLDALEIDLQQVNIENRDHIGLPMKESFAGLDFDIYLTFGHNNAQFMNVDYRRTYAYPQDQEKMIEDLQTVCARLTAAVETQPNTSFVFNWAETILKEEWDRDIVVWQDASILRRLMAEEFNGSLMWWDMTHVAGESVKEYLKTRGSDAVHSLGLSFYVSEYNGIGYIEVHY